MGTIIQFFQGHCKQFAVGYLWETCVLLYPEAHPQTFVRMGICLLACRVGSLEPARHFCFSPTSFGERQPFPGRTVGKHDDRNQLILRKDELILQKSYATGRYYAMF